MLKFTKKEILELLKAWAILSLAFAILLSGINIVTWEFDLGPVIISFIVSLLTVGLGFVLHELAHKIVAEKYGCQTYFKADNKMLLFALILSFFGFIFAAPGAVYIRGRITTKQNGKISAAGPLANLILALIFLPGSFLFAGILRILFSYGFLINAWIGLFNMIPAGNFDGAKIWRWSKSTFLWLAIPLLLLTLYSLLR